MAWMFSDYKNLILALMPRGKLWNREPGSRMDQVADGTGRELQRVDVRSDDLLVELRPGTTTEMIDEHEEDLGMPYDFMSPLGFDSLEWRRSINLNHYIRLGGQSAAFFRALAAEFEYDISIYDLDGHEWLTVWNEWLAFLHHRDRFNTINLTSGIGWTGDSIVRVPYSEPIWKLFDLWRPFHTRHLIAAGPDLSMAFSPTECSASRFLGGPFGPAFEWDFWKVRSCVDVVYYDWSGQMSRAFDFSFRRIFNGDFHSYEFSEAFQPMKRLNQIPYTGDFSRMCFGFGLNIGQTHALDGSSGDALTTDEGDPLLTDEGDGLVV